MNGCSPLFRGVVCGILITSAPLASHDAVSAQARVRVGWEAGLNQSKVSWALTPDVGLPEYEPAYRPAWSAGVTLDVTLAPKLSLATGVRYIEYGSLVEFGPVKVTTADHPEGTGEVFYFDLHQAWSYLAIPAQVRVRPFPARGVFLGFGPEVGYLLSVRERSEFDFTVGNGPPALQHLVAAVARPEARIFEKVGTLDSQHNYSPWNLMLSGSAGCEFPFVGHISFVEARYTHGLVDIAKNDAVKSSTRGFELLLGVRW